VRDPAQGEATDEVVEAVEVLEDQAELAHEPRVLEVLPEVRVELGDKERVVLRQRGNERGVDREVSFLPVAAPAGAAVAVEGLIEEYVPTLGNQGGFGIGRHGVARGQ
jgi:hypothetical protein